MREIYLKLKANDKRKLVSFIKSKTGLQETSIKSWCLGHRIPGTDRKLLIANYLGKDVNELFPEQEESEVF